MDPASDGGVFLCPRGFPLTSVAHKLPTEEQTFGPIPVGSEIARALDTMRYEIPTPIQEQAIPVMRTGRDVLGQAQTGTGKTAGFGIPLIESVRTEQRQVQAIVLVPTRELCLQVADEMTRLAEHTGVRILPVFGGVGLQGQIGALQRGIHIVVGTPGRVEDLLQRRSLRLDGVRVAILDEADRMLDIGFLPAIERILKQTPAERQTALFSATIPEEIRGLAHRQMRDPVTISVSPETKTVDAIEQRFQRVSETEKLDALCAHLEDPHCFMALVFRRTTYRADKLARDLARAGYHVAALHGRRTQGQRTRVLADLKACKLQVLVATDIAARGLDISGLTHVFNYDLPDTPETYVHRIGRTGRAGETGIAITFVTPEDEDGVRAIQRYLAGQSDKPRNNAPKPSGSKSGRPRQSGAPRSSSPSGASRSGSPSGGPRRGAPNGSGRSSAPSRTGSPGSNGRGQREPVSAPVRGVTIRHERSRDT